MVKQQDMDMEQGLDMANNLKGDGRDASYSVCALPGFAYKE